VDIVFGVVGHVVVDDELSSQPSTCGRSTDPYLDILDVCMSKSYTRRVNNYKQAERVKEKDEKESTALAHDNQNTVRSCRAVVSLAIESKKRRFVAGTV
jgi:hypothetical protein